MSDDTLVGAAIEDARGQMRKAVEHTQHEFASIRTGRATPVLIEDLRVEYYGTDTPLKQLAGFSVPEARVLVVTPYDKGAMAAIEKAISSSDLGLAPSNDGNVIRLTFPQLTEDRRKEMVKAVKAKAEDGKVQVRNARRDVRKDLEGLKKDGDLSEDELKGAEKDLDKLANDFVAEIDAMVTKKEAEVMEV